MAYKKDKDLEFLRELQDRALDNFVSILVYDKDGEKRHSEGLSSNPKYEEYFPQHSKYLDEILEEFQRFGGNIFTLSNPFRETGVSYEEILCDVADHLKVKYDKGESTENIEKAILLNFFNRSLENLSENELKEVAKEFSIDTSTFTKESISNAVAKTKSLEFLSQIAMLAVISIADKVAINMTALAANSVIAGSASAVATKATVFLSSRVAGVLVEPIRVAISGAWVANDIAGPAYEVTVPAVIYIAFLRSQYLYEKEMLKQMEKEEKEEKENCIAFLRRQYLYEKDMAELEDNLQKSRDVLDIIRGLKSKELRNLINSLELEKLSLLNKLLNKELNLLVVGPTGVGKSSTIEALFESKGKESGAKIGTTAKPETQDIHEYRMGSLTIYDSPGLGDSEGNDERHIEKIKNLLSAKDSEGNLKIDLVLVIADASSRDLGTTRETIKVIMGCMEEKERILIALNKCDMVGGRKGFDYEKNQPTEKSLEILDETVKIIQKRIKDDTGVDVEVVYYAAGEYDEEEGKKQPAYNLSKLLSYIIKKTPTKKRLVYLKHRSKKQEDFKIDDGKDDYEAKVEQSLFDTIKEAVFGAVMGVTINLVKEVAPKVVEAGISWIKKKF